MNSFRLHIVTPDSDFYTGDIEYLCVDTPNGKEGFMHGALPRIAVLSAGSIEIKTSVLELKAHCGGGLVYVNRDGITVLTENCRFDGDEDEGLSKEEEYKSASDNEYKTAKVKLAQSIKRMRDTDNLLLTFFSAIA